MLKLLFVLRTLKTSTEDTESLARRGVWVARRSLGRAHRYPQAPALTCKPRYPPKKQERDAT